MRQRIPLEAAAQAVCDQSAVPPLIFQLPPEEGRRRLEEAQNAPVYLYPADTAVRLTDTGGWGRVPVFRRLLIGSLHVDIIFIRPVCSGSGSSMRRIRQTAGGSQLLPCGQMTGCCSKCRRLW